MIDVANAASGAYGNAEAYDGADVRDADVVIYDAGGYEYVDSVAVEVSERVSVSSSWVAGAYDAYSDFGASECSVHVADVYSCVIEDKYVSEVSSSYEGSE